MEQQGLLFTLLLTCYLLTLLICCESLEIPNWSRIVGETTLLDAETIARIQSIATTTKPIVPSDGMVITSDTVFVSGKYNLRHGISIVPPEGADSTLTVDLNGAEFVGTNFTEYGISIIGKNREKETGQITVVNGIIHNYFYGIVVQNVDNVKIIGCDLSNNYYDPAALSDNPPWLNIFVTPDGINSDKNNFGGGIYMHNSKKSSLFYNKANGGENGLDMFNVDESLIMSNDFSHNLGWGIHLYMSSRNKIADNDVSYTDRKTDGDTSGVLLACSSSHNHILFNQMTHSGDGLYLAWTPEQDKPVCCSNDYNVIRGNNASFSTANCFESDFSVGCTFINNIATNCRFGFWLGYSRDTLVWNNQISDNEFSGVAIDHGINNIIQGNQFYNNGYRVLKKSYNPPFQPHQILIWTNRHDDYPLDKFSCLTGFDHTVAANYTITYNTFKMAPGSQTVPAINFQNVTSSLIFNNAFHSDSSCETIDKVEASVQFSLSEPQLEPNIIGGKKIGGNFYTNYKGCDRDGDGIGDTDLPYTNTGLMGSHGDKYPLTSNRC